MNEANCQPRIHSRGVDVVHVFVVEELRLTVAACNRPALVVFVNFLSAFDKLWFPALIRNLLDLEMPLCLVKWLFGWPTGKITCHPFRRRSVKDN